MNEALVSEIRSLAANQTRPSTILRRILAHEDYRGECRPWLFKGLREVFDVTLGELIPVGGWNYWEHDGYDDEELDRKLEGKLKPRSAPVAL